MLWETNMTTTSISPNNTIKKIKIVLADDHPLMRQAIRMWLEQQQDLEVLAEASDGRETVDIAVKLQPDVVIMDISMPSVNGLEATKQIISKCPHTGVLVLTVHTDTEHINNMMQAGAKGYLTKNVSGEEVVHAVRLVASGGNVLPNGSFRNIIGDSTKSTDGRNVLNPFYELTSRELLILKMVAKGMSNKSIASKLDISLRSVKANLTNVFIKLGAESRTEAIFFGLKFDVINLDDLIE
jgi:DNA-binding NarL/FixJ family response regulator